jgi:hypothetical protein
MQKHWIRFVNFSSGQYQPQLAKFRQFSHRRQKIVEASRWMVDTLATMKSAYELAMERLDKTAPAIKLTASQKKQLAELDSRYAAKIAGREIALNSEIAGAADDVEKEESLRDQLIGERKKLQAELEAAKEKVRGAAAK